MVCKIIVNYSKVNETLLVGVGVGPVWVGGQNSHSLLCSDSSKKLIPKKVIVYSLTVQD